MRIDRLAAGVVAPGGTLPFQLGRGHLNGVIVVQERSSDASELDAGRLTIRRRSDEGSRVLVSGLSTRYLAAISGAEGGYDRVGAAPAAVISRMGGPLKEAGMALHQASQVMSDGSSQIADAGLHLNAANSVATSVSRQVGPANLQSYFVNLGSIHLDSASDMEGHITVQDGPGYVAIYGLSVERTPDHHFVYDEALEMDVTHHWLQAAYLLYTGEGHALGSATTPDTLEIIRENLPDLTVQVDDDDGSTITDVLGAVVAESIVGRHETGLAGRAFRIYRTDVPSHEGVRLKILGGHSDDYVLMGRRIEYMQRATSASTVANVSRLRRRVEGIERRDPRTARAMRHHGLIRRSDELRRMEDLGREANADENAEA